MQPCSCRLESPTLDCISADLTRARLHIMLYNLHTRHGSIVLFPHDKAYHLSQLSSEIVLLWKKCLSALCLVCRESDGGCWDMQERRNRCACQHMLDSDTHTENTHWGVNDMSLSKWPKLNLIISEPVHSYRQWWRTLVTGLLPSVMSLSEIRDSNPSVPVPLTVLLVQHITPPGHHYLTQ